MKKPLEAVLNVVVPMILALALFFGMGGYAASDHFCKKSADMLSDKEKTVMELTATATAASAAITLIPGDTATPIAEKLADLSTDFVIVLCAILLEKYMIPILGALAFRLLLPLACVLWVISYFMSEKATLRAWGMKLTILGAVAVLVIPLSTWVSNQIDEVSNIAEETIEAAQNATDIIEGNVEEEEEESGGISEFFSGIKDTITGAALDLENIVSDYVESFAVMMVTSCLIPILVLLFFAWIVKSIFHLNIDFNRFAARGKRFHFRGRGPQNPPTDTGTEM